MQATVLDGSILVSFFFDSTFVILVVCFAFGTIIQNNHVTLG